ncbi:chloride channel protein [Candidatus Sumerlaeota bacterium]|nr:chloride channel protein [Candidatus Sumerlaeota bacterium]
MPADAGWVARAIWTIKNRFFPRSPEGEQAWMLVLAVVVGLVVGAVSALFRFMIRISHELFFRAGENHSLLNWSTIESPRVLVVRALLPAIGGLVVGFTIYRLLKLRGGHGVPNVMKAVATGNVNLSPSMMAKSWLSIITITSGGSVGQEGPSIEIGSVFGSLVGQKGQVSKDMIGTLIGCGAASGIAAVFNAPIGGVFLALELILRDFAVRTFAPVVLAAVVSSVTSQALLPKSAALIPIDQATFETITLSPLQIFAFSLEGLLCALVSALYVHMIFKTSDIFGRIKVPLWIKPAMGGLLVGMVGLFFPDVIGEGYAFVNESILNPNAFNIDQLSYSLPFFFLSIALVKITATSFTLGSGGTGGTFAPAMVVGACVGAGFGAFANQIAPGSMPAVPVFAMVGMAGCVGSAFHLPIAAVLIIYEVSGGNYLLVLPLMICGAISTVLVHAMLRGSVYTLTLMREGFDVEEQLRRRRDPALTTEVRRIMRRDFTRLRASDNLASILDTFSNTPDESFAVVDEGENLVGVISVNDLRGVLNMGDVGEAIIASDAADTNPRVLYPESTVTEALAIFTSSPTSGIPVLANHSSRRVIGMIGRGDLLQVYRTKDAARGTS